MRSEHFTLGLPPNARIAAGTSQGIELLMAIPKRQLKRAVDRNTVRRVAREAWRAATLAAAGGAAEGAPVEPTCALADNLAAPANAVAPAGSALLRLVIRPRDFASLPQGARKRLWRSELDTLFAGAFAARVAGVVAPRAR